ncbi:MAG TPA: VWA domain-containing protein [Methylophilaceae bacterium]
MKVWRNLDVQGRCLASAILLLMVSLLGPRAELPGRLHDWYFVTDITQSMNVRDVVTGDNSISRLEYSKRQMRHALRSLPCGSRVALGLFTERSAATILNPLEVCAHFAALDGTIAAIDWRMAWAADSYVANGVFSAIEQTERFGPDMRLAFFTDGDQAPPISSRYTPVFNGEPGRVRGVILGVGSQTAGQIPLLDEHDNITGYWGTEDVQRYATFGISEIKSVLEMEQPEGYHGRNAPHGRAPAEVKDAHLSAQNAGNLGKIAATTGLQYVSLDADQQIARIVLSGEMSSWRWSETDLRPWLVLPAMWLLLIFYIPSARMRHFSQRLSFRKKS